MRVCEFVCSSTLHTHLKTNANTSCSVLKLWFLCNNVWFSCGKEPYISEKEPCNSAIDSARLHTFSRVLRRVTWGTRWRRLIGSPKLQIIFHKRAAKYRALLLKMMYKDKGSYESSPPCNKPHMSSVVVLIEFILKSLRYGRFASLSLRLTFCAILTYICIYIYINHTFECVVSYM